MVAYENFPSQVGVNLQFYQHFAKFYQKRTKTQTFKNLSCKLFSIEGIIYVVSTGFWQNMEDHSFCGSRKFGKVWDVVGLNESLWYECPKVLVEL